MCVVDHKYERANNCGRLIVNSRVAEVGWSWVRSLEGVDVLRKSLETVGALYSRRYRWLTYVVRVGRLLPFILVANITHHP